MVVCISKAGLVTSDLLFFVISEALLYGLVSRVTPDEKLQSAVSLCTEYQTF